MLNRLEYTIDKGEWKYRPSSFEYLARMPVLGFAGEDLYSSDVLVYGARKRLEVWYRGLQTVANLCLPDHATMEGARVSFSHAHLPHRCKRDVCNAARAARRNDVRAYERAAARFDFGQHNMRAVRLCLVSALDMEAIDVAAHILRHSGLTKADFLAAGEDAFHRDRDGTQGWVEVRPQGPPGTLQWATWTHAMVVEAFGITADDVEDVVREETRDRHGEPYMLSWIPSGCLKRKPRI